MFLFNCCVRPSCQKDRVKSIKCQKQGYSDRCAESKKIFSYIKTEIREVWYTKRLWSYWKSDWLISWLYYPLFRISKGENFICFCWIVAIYMYMAQVTPSLYCSAMHLSLYFVNSKCCYMAGLYWKLKQITDLCILELYVQFGQKNWHYNEIP